MRLVLAVVLIGFSVLGALMGWRLFGKSIMRQIQAGMFFGASLGCLLILLSLAACAGISAMPKDEGRIKQSYVLLETPIIPTQAPTQTAEPTSTPTATIAAAANRSNFPHISDVAYDHIPNSAPGVSEDANDQGGAFMTGGDRHYAYFEQYICADYVDLRRVPDLNQPPRAYSVYGDVVHVHQRWNEWAFIGGEYWVELVYLCDF